MDYNISHSYALAVGHLADRIRGQGAFVGAWPDVDSICPSNNACGTADAAQCAGLHTGGDDGRFGARTYEAIIAFQKSAGLPLDGRPSLKLLRSRAQGGCEHHVPTLWPLIILLCCGMAAVQAQTPEDPIKGSTVRPLHEKKAADTDPGHRRMRWPVVVWGPGSRAWQIPKPLS